MQKRHNFHCISNEVMPLSTLSYHDGDLSEPLTTESLIQHSEHSIWRFSKTRGEIIQRRRNRNRNRKFVIPALSMEVMKAVTLTAFAATSDDNAVNMKVFS